MGIGTGAVDGMAVAGTAGTADGMAGTADGTVADTAACTAAAVRGAVVAGWGDMDTKALTH